MFCANWFCYTDRTNISIAILDFGYNNVTKGLVLAAFFYGYLPGQIPSSFLIEKFGIKKVYIAAFVLWTVSDFSTIFLWKIPDALSVTRALVGIGQAAHFPAMYDFSSAWFPTDQKTKLFSIASAGRDFGMIWSLAVMPVVAANLGWQYIYVISICVNFVLISLFMYFSSDEPKNFSIGSPRQAHLPWLSFFKHKAVWAIIISHFCNNYTLYVLMGWIPKYYSSVLKINIGSNSFLLALPYIFAYLGSVASGYLSDFLLKKMNVELLLARKIMNTVGIFAISVGLIILPFVTSVPAAVAILCLTLFLSRMNLAGFTVNLLDIYPNNSGQMMSITNTSAQIPGIIGNIITGQILDSTGSWVFVFAVASALALVGCVVFWFLSSAEPLEIVANEDVVKNAATSVELVDEHH